MIPRASYQTVSRLQQLLSAQNTQALPFQLKGSLTKSGEGKKKKIPCQRRAGLPAAQGALRRALRHPSPPADPGPVRPAWRGGDGCQPQPADPWGWQRVLLQPRGPSLLLGCFGGCQGSGVQGLGLGGWCLRFPVGTRGVLFLQGKLSSSAGLRKGWEFSWAKSQENLLPSLCCSLPLSILPSLSSRMSYPFPSQALCPLRGF